MLKADEALKLGAILQHPVASGKVSHICIISGEFACLLEVY